MTMTMTVTNSAGWEVEVLDGVHLGVALWIAEALGEGVDYVQAEDVADLARRALRALTPVTCDQCQLARINGLVCHETGCPNAGKTWESERGEWVKYVECRECGCDVEEGTPCCGDDLEPEPERGEEEDEDGDDLGDAVDHERRADGTCACGAVDCRADGGEDEMERARR